MMPYQPGVANLLPALAQQILRNAAATHNARAIDDAIFSVKQLYPYLFKKES